MKRTLLLTLTAIACAILVLAFAPQDGYFDDDYYEDDYDVGPAAGFSFTNMTDQGMIAGTGSEGGHGVAFVDVDGDGDLDIYVTNVPGGNSTPVPNYLYINDGSGRFRDEARARGVDGRTDFGAHGVVFADIDADGDFDLVVGNAGKSEDGGRNRLYINDGDGNFSDESGAVGFANNWNTRGITVGDFNGDELLDIIATNPLPGAFNMNPAAPMNISRFFRNKSGNSINYSRIFVGLSWHGFTQAITTADVDNDGDLDVIESGYGSKSVGGRTNTLWINDGKGKFTDASKTNLPATFWQDGLNYNGNALGDIDNDGDLDLVTVAAERIRLFRNRGDGTFADITNGSGLEGGGYTASFGDLNQDGKLDLLLADDARGHLVFEGRGRGVFRIDGNTGLFPPAVNDPRGVSLGDYDGDGDLDVVIIHKKNIAQLFRNDVDNDNFVKVLLTAPNGEVGAIGAKVWLYRGGKNFKEKALWGYREVGSSTGYISQNEPAVHFGLKKARKDVDLIIRFLDGSEVKMTGVTPGTIVTVDYQ